MNKKYTLNVQWTGERFEVKVPELGVSAFGATFDEAVENAHHAINAARLAALEAAKARHAQRRTVA
ncbi:MAG: hypothetical protein JOZ18_03690 [Chloroflexi bacterium]|nr:hypothetical protein [Chloroflexota bacterium]